MAGWEAFKLNQSFNLMTIIRDNCYQLVSWNEQRTDFVINLDEAVTEFSQNGIQVISLWEKCLRITLKL